jgi:hypothetical protein
MKRFINLAYKCDFTLLNKKINELRLKIKIFEPDVICVTETFFKAESVININNYNIFRNDRATLGDIRTYQPI